MNDRVGDAGQVTQGASLEELRSKEAREFQQQVQTRKRGHLVYHRNWEPCLPTAPPRGQGW